MTVDVGWLVLSLVFAAVAIVALAIGIRMRAVLGLSPLVACAGYLAIASLLAAVRTT